MGGILYWNGFFSDNFDLLIYSSYRVASGIIRKPVQRRIWNNKDYFEFRFLERVIVVNFCEY